MRFMMGYLGEMKAVQVCYGCIPLQPLHPYSPQNWGVKELRKTNEVYKNMFHLLIDWFTGYFIGKNMENVAFCILQANLLDFCKVSSQPILGYTYLILFWRISTIVWTFGDAESKRFMPWVRIHNYQPWPCTFEAGASHLSQSMDGLKWIIGQGKTMGF